MYKFIATIFSILFFCNLLFGLTQQEYIDKYLSDRDLESIEGIWVADGGRIIAVFNHENKFRSRVIRSSQVAVGSVNWPDLTKGSKYFYYGDQGCSYYDYRGWKQQLKATTCNLSILVQDYELSSTIAYPPPAQNIAPITNKWIKIWPEQSGGKNETTKKSSGASGTAFFLNKEGYLLTNNHVVEVCENNSKVNYRKQDIPAKIVAKDEQLDLALLKVDLNETPFIYLSNEAPKKLQRIIAAGYPLGKNLSDDLKLTSGVISSLKGFNDDSNQIQIDAALNKGNSGGPIVDEESAELVGVAVAILDKEEFESINFAIKINSVKNFLNSNQFEIPKKSFFNFGSDTAKALEEATVYTYCKNN